MKPKKAPKSVQKVNVDFPVDLLRLIDAEADRIGVPRQSWIKMRLADVMAKTTGEK
jgi:hypothetical protein